MEDEPIELRPRTRTLRVLGGYALLAVGTVLMSVGVAHSETWTTYAGSGIDLAATAVLVREWSRANPPQPHQVLGQLD